MNSVTKWEYTAAALNFTGATSLSIIENLGKEGWELCGIANDHFSTAYFKRPIYQKPPMMRPPMKKRKYKEQ